jgi:hypothetical protein
MKITRTKLLVAILVIICLANMSAALGQTDSSIESFWAKFRAAVIKSDKEAVATMVQFPIAMSYGVPAIRTKAQLFKRYRDLFNRQTDAVKCFAEARPEPDAARKDRFSVACKDAAGNETVVYGFVRTRGIWKLKSLDNINE